MRETLVSRVGFFSSCLEITVQDWRVMDANMPKDYNVHSYSQKCRQLLDDGLFKCNTDLYLVERQSMRPMGN
jgi:hypothetical protein